MEKHLAEAFDQLSSYDPACIRQGLRQIELLLVQICKISINNRNENKKYIEFKKLQDGFEFNISLRLVNCIEKLMGHEDNELTCLLLENTLEMLQGLLLLHKDSRRIFIRENYMTIMLDLLDIHFQSIVHEKTVDCLVCCFVGCIDNVRTFERLDGLASICSLFTQKDPIGKYKPVKRKILEFLFFYLLPETDMDNNSSLSTTTPIIGTSHRQPANTKTSKEKQILLSKHLNNVSALVNELKATRPLGFSA